MLSVTLPTVVTSRSGLDNLAQATVTGFPPDLVPTLVPEESSPAVVLQPHSNPPQDFATNVGLVLIHADDQTVVQSCVSS